MRRSICKHIHRLNYIHTLVISNVPSTFSEFYRCPAERKLLHSESCSRPCRQFTRNGVCLQSQQSIFPHLEVKSLGIELVEGCALAATNGPLLLFFARGKPSNPSTTSSLLPASLPQLTPLEGRSIKESFCAFRICLRRSRARPSKTYRR